MASPFLESFTRSAGIRRVSCPGDPDWGEEASRAYYIGRFVINRALLPMADAYFGKNESSTANLGRVGPGQALEVARALFADAAHFREEGGYDAERTAFAKAGQAFRLIHAAESSRGRTNFGRAGSPMGDALGEAAAWMGPRGALLERAAEIAAENACEGPRGRV